VQEGDAAEPWAERGGAWVYKLHYPTDADLCDAACRRLRPGSIRRHHGWRDDHYLSEPADKIWACDEIKAVRNQKRIRQDFVNLNAKTRAKKTKEATLKFNLCLMDT
jgi:hypothetical protein